MQARKAAKRQAFLDAATRLFGKNGYHATTVPQIVEATGTSTGSFYSYFDNKEDVFAAALREVGERLAGALNTVIEQADGPADRMHAAVAATFRFLAENPADARILIVESSGLTAHLERIRREIHDSHARSVEAALREALGVSATAVEPAVLARCWTGAVYEAVRWWLALDAAARPPADRMGEAVAAFNLRGAGLCD